jgi:hypothetical protein
MNSFSISYYYKVAVYKLTRILDQSWPVRYRLNAGNDLKEEGRKDQSYLFWEKKLEETLMSVEKVRRYLAEDPTYKVKFLWFLSM